MREEITPASPPKRILESVVVTVSIPLIGYAIHRSDPFFIHHRFPWLVFAPLLVGLRHGSLLGFGSAFALGVTLILAWRTRLVPMAGFPGESVVGLVALAMIAGQFADLWKRQAMRQDRGLAELRSEADRLARAHFLLETSHARLDEQIESTTSSLREAMRAMSELPPERVSLVAQGSVLLDLFATYCGLEIGELFSVERGQFDQPCAVIGRPEPTRRDDPLLVQALRSGRLTYVPPATDSAGERSLARSSLLAAIPFVDGLGVVHGVLTVHAMPLLSFDKRNLDTMVTIAATFADRLRETRERLSARVAFAGGASA